ncbi:MAG: pyrroline-5-carboxylate reductase [Lachnospira sp.]|nr:pyrroline-5-carboxylate reductase [Lachnospira sp.]
MKIGFIGCGNMAQAMIGGLLKKEVCQPADIIASAKTQATLGSVKNTYGIETVADNRAVAQAAEVIVLAVKPMYYEGVIGEIKEVTDKHQIIISIAPGKTLRWLAEQFGDSEYKVVRTMPNTPALVGEGVTGYTLSEGINEEDHAKVRMILESFGMAEQVSEGLMDVVVSVSGSSPAYVFMFIEAMADAAVADGMPRKQAYTFAAQAVLGSAKLVLETGKHPAELKDMVCSPGGTTIEAVRVLEKKGMRSSVIEAMKACVKKARDC